MDNLSKTERVSFWNAFWAAMQFLTITPAVVKRPFTALEMGASIVFYPLVGLIIGLFLSLSSWLLQKIFPVQLTAALILGIWVILSGALHLDGFLDACDGLCGGWTPEKRLEIMRDKHHGSFALAGGVILFLVKFSALISCELAPLALILSPMLARWGMSMAIVAFPYQRQQGTGRTIKDQASWKGWLFATLFMLGITAIVSSISGWIALVVVVVVVWGGAKFTLRLIPGLSGDIYGAINEVVELAVLLIFGIWNTR